MKVFILLLSVLATASAQWQASIHAATRNYSLSGMVYYGNVYYDGIMVKYSSVIDSISDQDVLDKLKNTISKTDAMKETADTILTYFIEQTTNELPMWLDSIINQMSGHVIENLNSDCAEELTLEQSNILYRRDFSNQYQIDCFNVASAKVVYHYLRYIDMLIVFDTFVTSLEYSKGVSFI